MGKSGNARIRRVAQVHFDIVIQKPVAREYEAGVKALAELPSLDELRAKLVGMIQTPATRIAGILQAPGGQVARVLNAYATREEAA